MVLMTTFVHLEDILPQYHIHSDIFNIFDIFHISVDSHELCSTHLPLLVLRSVSLTLYVAVTQFTFGKS